MVNARKEHAKTMTGRRAPIPKGLTEDQANRLMLKRKSDRERFHIRKENRKNGVDPATTRKPRGMPIQSTNGLSEKQIRARESSRLSNRKKRRKDKGLVSKTCCACVLISHTILMFFLIFGTGAPSCG